MKKTTTICIDLAKEIFQVGVFNKYGKLLSNRAVKSEKMMDVIHQHPEAFILMEACGSAHHWARVFMKLGHEVKLIPAHIVANCRLGNKNDGNDVLAIYEAAKRPKTYYVSVRTFEQQEIATLQKLRQGYVQQRTEIANRLRGFGLEYGVKFPTGINKLRKRVPEALEDADNTLTTVARSILHNLLEQLRLLDQQVDETTKDLVDYVKPILACKHLFKMPGIGWLGAAALYAKLGDGAAFRRGRDASACIGLVPSHRGSGGKNRLGKISNRGDKYLRYLLIHGARAVVNNIRDKQDALSCWIRSQLATKHKNNTTVALANKMVRMAWALLRSGSEYRVPVAR